MTAIANHLDAPSVRHAAVLRRLICRSLSAGPILE
jgi:hypothetical protein